MCLRPKTTCIALLSLLAGTAPEALRAQDRPDQQPLAPPPLRVRFDPELLEWEFQALEQREDVVEWWFTGGVRYADPALGLDVRCDRALLVLDRQETGTALRTLDRDDGLPRRAPALPPARRALGEAVLRARLNSFMLSMQQRPVAPAPIDFDLEIFRAIYLEGGVTVVQDGVEVLRAKSLYFAPADDRAVLRDVLLRLRDTDSAGQPVQVVVRTDELVRQRGRMVARDVSVTTSRAGIPSFEVLSGEVEIRERADAFEIRSRDNVLAFSQTPLIPLPNQTFVTGEQTNLPIRSASAGHSEREGAQLGVVLGGAFNELGGSAHEALTGRPATEFVGDWQLGVEWIQERGFPLDAELEYRGGELYEGRALGFFLDDDGEDIREIQANLDGTPITEDQRRIVWTENRVRLGEHTSLDLTLFDASDPAAWSEFYRARYLEDERPESSIHLRHAQRNWLATATGRFDLPGFSYGDGRQLVPRFVEEVPYLTLDGFAERIATLPGDTPVLLTSSTGVARLRSAFDERFASPIDDETWRLDQALELATPFHLGPVGVRPFGGARYTHYQHAVDGDDDGRVTFDAGVEVGTRLSRTWRLSGSADGETSWLRHVVSPTVRFEHRYRVEGDPIDFPQFDAVDALDEGANIRIGLLQRVQIRRALADEVPVTHEWAWLDLAQNITPISDRDNAGHRLGLFEFELLLRPYEISDNVELGIGTEGEHDWNEDDLRTFNNYFEVKTAGVTWIGLYRTDRTADGQIGYGVSVPFRHRWVVSGTGLYDLETRDTISYATQLVRQDLDWNLTLSVTYDVVTDDTAIRFDFEPTFGGLFRPRDRFPFETQGDRALAY